MQHLIRVAAQRAEHRHERGIARAGDGWIGKGDLPAQRRVEKIGPAAELSGGQQLRIVDQHDRKRGKRRPAVILRTVLRQNLLRAAADVGLKQRPAGFETLDAAAEHHVGPWCVLLLLQLLKQFVCAALYDLDPDSGARFKFLDDRPPDLFFVRGVQNETLRFIRRVGGCILCGGRAAGQKSECYT